MQLAVDWIREHLDQSTSVAIFTDSQSVCLALLGSSPDLDAHRLSINNIVALSHIQWIPGHCDIRGNELADSAAKSATSLPPKRWPSRASARQFERLPAIPSFPHPGGIRALLP